MRSLPPARKAFAVVKPTMLYRPVGRRLSNVYVNADFQPAAPDEAAHRLAERVYERIEAQPGDQLQDRVGGLILVSEDGGWFPVRLAEPRPRDVKTAFSHAEVADDDDRQVVDGLVAGGFLEEVKPRRLRGGVSRSSLPLVSDGHPLVVDERAPAKASQA
ncbi:MAG TPA: hypothetical protein VIG90_14080 [Pedomonas sp.]|uniref:hypothetical protein n=1 Tax=Pedomonas sp. TaxID=2976421 RepID=UPI002F3E4D95